MKFLCVPCDSPMTLQSVGPPQRGSLAVVYTCPACGYEMAMLTNAYETQVVQSLGVRIGPDRTGADRAGADRAAAGSAFASADGTAAAGKCPFSAMIPGAEDVGLNRPPPIRWTAAAEARLTNIPEFVRPMARTGIEKFAQERGAIEVDDTLLDAARDFFGM